MGIDLITGEHICFGLAIGDGCESCRKKYPHLLATTPEQIEAGKRNLQAAITAYTNDISGEKPMTREELNSFGHFVPPSDTGSTTLPDPTSGRPLTASTARSSSEKQTTTAAAQPNASKWWPPSKWFR